MQQTTAVVIFVATIARALVEWPAWEMVTRACRWNRSSGSRPLRWIYFISLNSRRSCGAERPLYESSLCKIRIGTGKKVKRVERGLLERAELPNLSVGASRQFRSWEEPLVRKGRSEQQSSSIQSFSCASAIACGQCHLLGSLLTKSMISKGFVLVLFLGNLSEFRPRVEEGITI